MKRAATTLLATGLLLAAGTTVATGSDKAALIAEEKDRLAREKQEMEARQALLEKQLQTSQKLVAEKEAYMKQLQEEIRKLKSGK